MRFKVDENLHAEVTDLLRLHGHDAHSVFDEGICGRPDSEIATIAVKEKRALITLDLDFGNIRDYPPEKHHGLIVLRVSNQSRADVTRLVNRVLSMLGSLPMEGRLWIVSDAAIRIRPGLD